MAATNGANSSTNSTASDSSVPMRATVAPEQALQGDDQDRGHEGRGGGPAEDDLLTHGGRAYGTWRARAPARVGRQQHLLVVDQLGAGALGMPYSFSSVMASNGHAGSQ